MNNARSSVDKISAMEFNILLARELVTGHQEPTISTGERLQTYAFHCAAIGTGDKRFYVSKTATSFDIYKG